MALNHTWKICEGQSAFKEFVCQSQRWVGGFMIAAYFLIVAITLSVIMAEAGEWGHEAEGAACLFDCVSICIHLLFLLAAVKLSLPS